MRILQVVDQLGVEYGGSALAVRRLSSELANRGHEVVIYAANVGTIDLPNNVAVCSFKVAYTYAGSIRFTPSMLLADFSDFDIIHLHNYYTFQNLVARLKSGNIPIIWQPHGTLVLYDGVIRGRRRIQELIDPLWRKWFVDRVNVVVCASPIEVEQAKKLGIHDPKLIPLGVDL